MGIKVRWMEKGGAYFLVGDDGQVHGKAIPDVQGPCEAHLDGNYLGEFWDCYSAKARIERQIRMTPYEFVREDE